MTLFDTPALNDHNAAYPCRDVKEWLASILEQTKPDCAILVFSLSAVESNDGAAALEVAVEAVNKLRSSDANCGTFHPQLLVQ